jgi:hypothetical protein
MDWRSQQIGMGVSRCPRDPEGLQITFPITVTLSSQDIAAALRQFLNDEDSDD